VESLKITVDNLRLDWHSDQQPQTCRAKYLDRLIGHIAPVISKEWYPLATSSNPFRCRFLPAVVRGYDRRHKLGL
jgi:hypothetical protein